MPRISAPTDVVVRMTRTTICGTDLHILGGRVPTCEPGRVLGHEGVGVVAAKGPGVMMFGIGDKVLISCISACGQCDRCRRLKYSRCLCGGWMLGHTIDGTQAEFVRIPFADHSLYLLPDEADEDALVMLSDVMPTAFECGVLGGQVQAGRTVAIIGAGPVGMAALLVAQLYAPAAIIVIDMDEARLQIAVGLGATTTVDGLGGRARKAVVDLTRGRGVDTAIDTVGLPASTALCRAIIGTGGRIASVADHAVAADRCLEHLWDRNITADSRLVDTISTLMLLNMVRSEKLDPSRLVTHHFKLDRIRDAYETFAHSAATRALKVIVEVPPPSTDGRGLAGGS
ncbi:alcohol dehydrogenase catalytic domain-containing protein [Zavarzinia sp.]|uniref:alcohol dehydrogenase catalytic domain-containing protein n=1 Tax=Zavarzinia sp. TaxID=2027920 RepID=UPI003BB78B5A